MYEGTTEMSGSSSASAAAISSVTETPTLTRTEKRRVEVLRRRLGYLEIRIQRSGTDLSFDRAEAAALRWVISCVTGEKQEWDYED